MEFYLNFNELLGESASPVLLIFVPVFFITTVICSGHTKLSGPTFRSAMDWRIHARPPTTPSSSPMRMSG